MQLSVLCLQLPLLLQVRLRRLLRGVQGGGGGSGLMRVSVQCGLIRA